MAKKCVSHWFPPDAHAYRLDHLIEYITYWLLLYSINVCKRFTSSHCSQWRGYTTHLYFLEPKMDSTCFVTFIARNHVKVTNNYSERPFIHIGWRFIGFVIISFPYLWPYMWWKSYFEKAWSSRILNLITY